METAREATAAALGIGQDDFGAVQMALRAAVVYVSALAMVRLGEKRFFGKNTAFDLILGIIFGSVVSRAVNGSAALVPTLLAGATLIALHWILAVVSFHFSPFGTLVKGRPRTLVRDGTVLHDAMRKSHLSDDDLELALREEAQVTDVSRVQEARLERSGNISVLTRSAPRVVEVEVQEGVQTVRIRID